MSMARSYDETTVRPPIKSLRTDSFYSSKALSSQHISDVCTIERECFTVKVRNNNECDNFLTREEKLYGISPL